MTTYIALTIGPIYKTFQNVRKTREVWAASYLFSYILRKIIEELLNNSIKHESFIVPYIDTDIFPRKKDRVVFDEDIAKGTGLFPDRCIIESGTGDYNKVENAVENVLKDIEVLIGGASFDYVKEYFRFCFIEKELPEAANVIEEMFRHLDTLELQNKTLSPANANNNDLFNFFRSINKHPFFKKFALNQDINKHNRFESVVEISTKELQGGTGLSKKNYKDLVNEFLWNANKDDDIDSDQKFIEALKESLPDQFKPYHKYIAIIKADGDKIGAAIKSMNGEIKALQAFSKSLYDWAIDTDKKVRSYGGVPIYIGGDDVLLFAPVAMGAKTVVDLIEDIDKSFELTVGKHKFIPKGSEIETAATLSYGISISYYKFPLSESINKVEELLKEAKNYSDERNSVCIRVLKHSGSELKSTITKKRDGAFQYLKEILDRLNDEKLNKEKSFLNSVMYKLRDNESILEIIGNKQERVENFIDNNFDDYNREFDKCNGNGKYLHTVKKLTPYAFNEADILINHSEPDEKKRRKSVTEQALNNIYSTLRISRFIKGIEDDK